MHKYFDKYSVKNLRQVSVADLGFLKRAAIASVPSLLNPPVMSIPTSIHTHKLTRIVWVAMVVGDTHRVNTFTRDVINKG